MKIDFQHFKTFVDITHKDTIEDDIRRVFADLIYKNANGIMAHDIAMRIYKTEGPVEFSAEETNFLDTFVQQTTPIFQDSYKANVTE